MQRQISLKKSLWQIFTGGHTADITALAMEPITGEHCASASKDGMIVIWNNGTPCFRLFGVDYEKLLAALAMPVHRIDVSKWMRVKESSGVTSLSWCPSRKMCALAVSV